MNTMKKIALLTALFFLLTGTGFTADQTIAATEEMVGSGHATKTDTLNRLGLVEHNTDGTHKSSLTLTSPALVTPALGTPASGNLQNTTAYPGLAITAGKTITVTQNTSLDEAVAMSSKAPKASPTFTGLVTTAGQIAFPATANPSSNVNTLDDYEEGTWTLTMTPATSGSITVSSNTGTYTKIGRVVTVIGSFTVSSVSSPVGFLVIGGLPFTRGSGDTFAFAGAIYLDTWQSGMATTAWLENGDYLFAFAAGARVNNTANFAKAGSVLKLSMTYFV
ncbi:MAG: hypothetical protein ABIH23_12305 [bacterium]